ncbi:alkaline phosphatase synthesis sensor protein PhoR [bacterium BMS3Abin02]|nr:alkaline phosphatase synthesis sensor protein PhoR [bacterium BMS3Abin02]GBE20718.1 alkaline phosphatase synthesis sensor protein PhoR [bacterium BMS3Bbin01]
MPTILEVVSHAHPEDFRTRTAVLGMRVMMLLILALVVTAYLNGLITDLRVWGPALLTFLAVVLLTLLQWTTLQHRWLGRLLLWLLFAVVIASLTAAGTIPELQSAVLAADLAVVALSAVMTGLIAHTTISVLVAASYLAVALTGGERPADIIVPLVAVAGVSLAVGMLTRGFRRESRLATERLETLKAREVDLARLYDVSTATSAAETVQEALPVLVGRIGQYLHAQVGALLLRDPHRPYLNVMSPIWTVGNALEVDGYRIPLRNAGDLERVYLSGSPAIFQDIDQDPDVHGLLGELGVHNAIAAPMKVEDRTLGVMVLADKVDGTFTEDDVEALVSLSTPTALAIAQLERIEEAAQTSKKMEELAAMKTDFVSVVSHELRTPLTSIIGSLATLTRPEFQPADEMARDLLDSARSQADRLRRLIEDLLIVSRIEGRALPTQHELIDLEALLAAALVDIPNTERVTIECAPISLRSDPDHLQRIVINLVENALRYAPDAAVEVTATESDGAVTISVVDHGPGIPAEVRDRVFERFTQLGPTSTRKQGGTGLGLAIVRGLVSALGGTVRLKDTPGGGATFEVWIPKAPPDAPSGQHKRSNDEE